MEMRDCVSVKEVVFFLLVILFIVSPLFIMLMV